MPKENKIVTLLSLLANHSTLVLSIVAAVFYTIAAALSPLADFLGIWLLVGVVVPIGLFLVTALILILRKSTNQRTTKSTYLMLKFKDDKSIEMQSSKEIIQGNIKTYSCNFTTPGLLMVLVAFKKPIKLLNLRIDAMEKEVPSHRVVLFSDCLCLVEIDGGAVKEGQYKIIYNY